MKFPLITAPETRRNVRRLIRLALDEDLPGGDVTSRLSVPAGTRARAVIIAREALVVCGLPLLREIVIAHHAHIQIRLCCREGSRAAVGTVLAELSGSARELLELERTMLNFLQRLCGVATHTSKVMKRARGLRVLDTRKTMPGWRALDKYAVKVGGDTNHRASLSDMILVKNNHIDGAGSVEEAMTRIMKGRPKGIRVEVEVRSLKELQRVIPFRPDIVMLDNFTIPRIRAALALLRTKLRGCTVEVSGGVTPRRFSSLRKAGVTLVSMGALTTQAQNVDISMRVSLGVR